MTLKLPRAAILAAWMGPWLRGEVAPDDLLEHLDAGHEQAAHVLTGLAGSDGAVPMALGLGRLRGLGATGASVALPVPGDPLGLRGPAGFNARVLEHGEGVLVESAGVGLVPVAVGRAVEWRVLRCEAAPWLDPGEEGRHLRQTLLDVTAALVELDVGTWQPEIPDAVMNLRHRPTAPVPRTLRPRDRETIDRALLCLDIVALARATPAGALTAAETARRDDALTVLDRAARRALVACCR